MGVEGDCFSGAQLAISPVLSEEVCGEHQMITSEHPFTIHFGP